MMQTSSVTVELAGIMLLALTIGFVLGRAMIAKRARLETAAYQDELLRVQRQLRALERRAIRPGRGNYGAAARR